jgi:hypothetical protein
LEKDGKRKEKGMFILFLPIFGVFSIAWLDGVWNGETGG